MNWYFPSFNGDFRLKKRGDACTLIVIKATPAEQTQLEKFAQKVGKYVGPTIRNNFESRGFFQLDQEIALDLPLDKAGKILLKFVRAKKAVLTAVVSEGGKVTVTEDTEAGIDALAKPDTKAAASVSRPTPCCPNCIPGSVARASEVLLSFLTPQEHQTWAHRRYIIVEGGISGHRYVIAHRNSERGVKQHKICYDLDDGELLHFHDWNVPPEEEVLAAKLILQHREPWLRNEATTLGSRRPYVFKNPFGGLMDGVADANLTRAIGSLLPKGS